ncbi:MAG: ATP synthase F1 subunit delta [Erysipelotrichaceae bacterium]|nr:ATP synthase F1 subunit delta [Erysipelotrichaceae bacterium]
MDTIASRYGQSLFDLAIEKNQVGNYLEQLNLVSEVFGSDPKIGQFFSHVIIDDSDKMELIEKSFKESLDKMVLNFLKLLIKNRRMKYFSEIFLAYKDLANDYLGIEEGIVYTPSTLSDEQLTNIAAALSKSQNKKVVLRQVIKPSLIGGLKVVIKNRVIDGSVQNRIELMRKELLRK